MRKLSLLSLLFAVYTSIAVAADKPGDHCPTPGVMSQVGGEVMTCVGKWKLVGQVGTTPVKISVQLLDGSKILSDMNVATLDGQPTPVSIGKEHTYIASATKEGDKVTFTPGVVRDGFSMTLTPTLTLDDKIEVEVIATKAELVAINKIKQGDMEVDLPQINTMELKQKIAVGNGKQVTIPFGPVVKSEKAGEAERSQYTLKITATKG